MWRGPGTESSEEVPVMRRPGWPRHRPESRFLSFATVLALAACGGGGGGTPDSTPSISNLQFAPTSVLQYDGDGHAGVGGTLAFTDKGGDLATLHLATSQGQRIEEPIAGAAGIKSGTISGGIEIDTSVIGRYTFEIYVIDAGGRRSNTLSGTFEVAVNDTGVRWTPRSLPLPSGSSVVLTAVVRGGALFVAVGDGIFTSPDGITWTEQRLTSVVPRLNDVAWNGSRYVAVGDGGVVLTSPDGAAWTIQPVPTLLEPVLSGVAASGNRYVAVGRQWSTTTSTYAELILTSPDGANWSEATPSHSMVLNGITWSGSKFVAVGSLLGGPNAEAAVLVSSDGLAWTRHAVGALSSLGEIAWNGSQFVATGYAGAVRSPDGVTWTQVGQGTVGDGAIAWSGQRFLVCSIVYCQSSTDGVQWGSAGQLPGIGPYVRGLAWDGTKWVAVGTASGTTLLLTSP
jgi:hypothetical protein